MQEMPVPPDPSGFVVEWQLADDAVVIDLSGEEADSEVILADDAAIAASSGD